MHLEVRAIVLSLLLVVAAGLAYGFTADWARLHASPEAGVELVNEHELASATDLQSTLSQHLPLALREFRSRLLVTLTASLVLVASSLMLAYSVPKFWMSPFWVVVFIAAVTSFFCWYVWNKSSNHIFPMYGNLFDRVESLRGITVDSESESIAVVSFGRFGNGLVVFAAISFTVSVWNLLSRLGHSSSESDDEESLRARTDSLKKADRAITIHLYLASVLLILSVISLHVYYTWPATIVVDETLAKELQGLATVVALVFGTGFTYLMIVVIGPAVYVVNRRTEELASSVLRSIHGDVSEADTKNWREENGFVATSQQKSIGVLAVIGPLLAGPLLDLLNILLGLTIA